MLDNMKTQEDDATRLFRANLQLFDALGDKTRQQILFLLADRSRLSVAELTAATKLSRPAISHHLKILFDAKLLRVEKDGRKRYYTPIFTYHLPKIRALLEALEKISCEQERTDA